MMKDQAEIVIIGGGVIGISIAYHLAQLGRRDVLLLERNHLTHGATWHAAGLVGQLRSKLNLTRMLQYSVELYDRLEAETGVAIDWRQVGSLRLASSAERWMEVRRTATTARSFGFELHLLNAREAQEKFPLITTDGIVGAAWIPSDGYVDPSGLTQALARGARAGDVRIEEGVTVTGFERNGRRITGVQTDHGLVRAETVVNAAGMWARGIGELAGVPLATCAVEHQYLVTEKIPGVTPVLPTLRDPDRLFYLKPEVGGLSLGGWEPDTVPFGEQGVPADFDRGLLNSNFDRFEQIATKAASRIPAFGEVGVRDLINGPIPMSADGEPVLGPAPELDNFFVACGFTAGIAAAGGAGRAMAAWIVDGDPGMDLWSFDARRFGRHHTGRRFLHRRGVESYGRYYAIHWPGEEMERARGARRSPLHALLARRGAAFGSKAGWERPNWFAPEGVEPRDRPSFTEPNWTPFVAAEHHAVRGRVALVDLTSFSKFEISGRGAAGYLQWLAANDLDRAPGAVTYTQLLNRRGGIEADVTITRLDEGTFYLVTGSGFAVRDLGWVTAHMPRDGSVRLRDVTSARAVINLCGPLSREVLAAVTDADLDNKTFPFMNAREIWIGYAPVLAIRVSYTGELGYELHVPSEYAAHVYETLREAGGDHGIADAGYRAIDTLRVEKRNLYWGVDITPDYTPWEAGLGFCVALDKGDFQGRDALIAARDAGRAQRLSIFTLDDDTTVHGGEALLCNGEVIGVTTSGNFGHTVGKPIVFAYLPTALANSKESDYEVESFCERYSATRHRRPLYDPDRRRILM